MYKCNVQCICVWLQEGKENKAGCIKPLSADKVTVYVDPPAPKPDQQDPWGKDAERTAAEQEAYELMVQGKLACTFNMYTPKKA